MFSQQRTNKKRLSEWARKCSMRMFSRKCTLSSFTDIMVWCGSSDDDMTRFGMISFKWLYHTKKRRRNKFYRTIWSANFRDVIPMGINGCLRNFSHFNLNGLNESSNFSFMSVWPQARVAWATIEATFVHSREHKIKCNLTKDTKFMWKIFYVWFSIFFFLSLRSECGCCVKWSLLNLCAQANAKKSENLSIFDMVVVSGC